MKGFGHLFDSYAGQTCIVVGNGPSLKNVDPLLYAYPTFGSNRVYLKFNPTFYVCVNPLVANQYRNDISKIDCVYKFMLENAGFKDDYELHSVRTPLFSFSPSDWVYEGYTVTFVSLQLAFFMGFTTVFLVGVDHRYAYEGAPNEERVLIGSDPNHFDESYFSGAVWNNPDLERSEEAYKLAKEAYEMNGRRIFNATPGSALKVFEAEEETWRP